MSLFRQERERQDDAGFLRFFQSKSIFTSPKEQFGINYSTKKIFSSQVFFELLKVHFKQVLIESYHSLNKIF